MSTTPSNKRASRVTTTRLAEMKAAGERIVMVTAYDAPGARAADAAGVDAILVGDSLGMTVLGYDSTLPVTMSDMARATAAVSRGASRALVVADLPFLSYQVSIDEAVRNAGRLLVEGSAQAVKLEGGVEVADLVNVLVDTGIPVMGHVGLTPQSVNVFGGYKTQGKDTESAVDLVEDCLTLEAAGAFAVVLELVPVELARLISEELTIPTIGIGAGVACDGQVQVFHDVLGIGDFTPRHARRYAEIGEAITAALAAYASDVRSGSFPAEEQSTHLDPEVAAELDRMVPFTEEGA
ncbi:MAG TPA: 3-methyl-2-oxobutanoate hydroxymethyltransferase [Actinobacteria bacterium]|nr:3-methyl-2-oxobutanoate hydroxymethyltransferase [Actinomycetota bacterium]